MASRIETSFDWTVISSRPEVIGIQLARYAKFGLRGRLRFDQIVPYSQRPSCVRQDFLDADTWMHGRQKGLAIVAETQHAERGDHGGRSRSWRQTVRAPPIATGAETRGGDMANAVGEPP